MTYIKHDNEYGLEGDRFDWSPDVSAPLLEPFIKLVTTKAISDPNAKGLSPDALAARDAEYAAIARQLLVAMHNATTKRFPVHAGVVAVPLGNCYYSKTKPSQSRIAYSARYVRKIVKILEDLELVTVEIGIESRGFSRLRPTGKFLKTLEPEIFLWHKQLPLDTKKIILMFDGKGKKRKQIEITGDVSEIQQQLYSYNKFIINHCIALDVDDTQLKVICVHNADVETNSIDFSRVQLRRMFSRGSLDFHGRLYGGWWQNIPALYRRHITIDGYKTREVDFSGIVPRILYAKKGIQLPLDTDIYDLGLPGWEGKSDPRRPIVKAYVNALINDEKETYKLSTEALEQLQMSQDQLKQLFLNRHEAIRDSLATKDGLRAMRIESNIAMTVLLECKARGIVALPIHDSFVVRAGEASVLADIMKYSFMHHLKAAIGTKADIVGSGDIFGVTEEELGPDATNGGAIVAAEAYRELLKTPAGSTHMSRYVSSWEQYVNNQ